MTWEFFTENDFKTIADFRKDNGDLMERQIVIHLAGGIAEAISRGERRKHAVLRFAKLSCNADADLKLAAAVLADLRKLTGRRLRAYTNKSE
jgi:hypothetical protein